MSSESSLVGSPQDMLIDPTAHESSDRPKAPVC